jgi:hypothetical protein
MPLAAEHPQQVVGPDLVGDQGAGHPQHVRPGGEHLLHVHHVAGQRLQRPVAAQGLAAGHLGLPEPLVFEVLEARGEAVAEHLEDAEHHIGVRGRFILLFHPGMRLCCADVGSRQEMVLSPVRRRAMRSVMARWIMASERCGWVS